MKRTSLNLIVDVSAGILLLGMIATGYVLRFPLPPGTHKSHTLLGVTRHGWGGLHFWISTALLMVLLVHVILHWPWIVSVIAKRFDRKISEKQCTQIGLLASVVLAGASVLFAWITYRSVRPIIDPSLVGVSLPVTSDEEATQSIPSAGQGGMTSKTSYTRDVAPILERSCLGCHGPNRAAGNFRIDRKLDFFTKLNRDPLVVPGNSSESTLIDIVAGRRGDIPQPHQHRLPEGEVTVLRAWIDAGAEW
jgi:hypothetical protein